MKIVIIGSGAAGISAIQSIRGKDPEKQFDITLISAERETTYSPCALPYVISNDIPYKRLSRLDSNFFRKMKVQTFWGSPVCRIDPGKKSIVLKNGKTIFYDRLLIATGSVPIKPPIPGIEKKGVFFVDTLGSTRRIKRYLKSEKIIPTRKNTGGGRVAIIGAGFTGIETALALRKQCIKVVVLEMLDRVLARILDSDFAKIVQDKIESLASKDCEKGIEFYLKSQVTEIKGKEKVKSITLKNGDNIPVDMVIVSIGVRPNIDFLNGSGVNAGKGIIVNDRMQTNIADIYAAGDAVETFDYISGEKTISAIWANAVEQGKVAALNMIDGETRYPGAYSINVLNIEGLPVVSMGKIPGVNFSVAGDSPLQGNFTRQNENSLRRLFYSKGSNGGAPDKIIGFESIGEFRNQGFIWACIQKGTACVDFSEKILKDSSIPFAKISATAQPAHSAK